MIPVPDFANIDIQTLYDYVNALENQNTRRNQQRIALEGELKNLQSTLAYQEGLTAFQIECQKTLQKKLDQSLSIIKDQSQKLEETSRASIEQEDQIRRLRGEIKKLKGELSKNNHGRNSEGLSQSRFSDTAEGSIFNTPPATRSTKQQTIQTEPFTTQFENDKRALEKYKREKQKEISQILQNHEEDEKKLKRMVLSLQQELSLQSDKRERYQFRFKEASKELQQQKAQHFEEVQRLKSTVEKRNQELDSFIKKRIQEKPKPILSSLSKTTQTQINGNKLLENISKNELFSNTFQEDKGITQRAIKELEEIIEKKNKQIDLIQNKYKKLIRQATGTKIGSFHQVQELESSNHLQFEEFREESLRLMRQMQIHLARKDSEIARLSRINKQIKSNLIDSLKNLQHKSEDRENLIRTQGQLAFYKSKLARIEAKDAKSRQKKLKNGNQYDLLSRMKLKIESSQKSREVSLGRETKSADRCLLSKIKKDQSQV